MKNTMKRSGSEARDYLVIASVGSVEKKFVWNTRSVMPLDFPTGWTLAYIQDNICLFDQSLPDVESMEKELQVSKKLSDGQKMIVTLPPAHKGNPHRSLNLTLTPLTPLKAPYDQISKDAYNSPNVKRQLMMYTGVRYFLSNYRPVGGQLTINSNGQAIFSYSKTPDGYAVTSHVADCLYKTRGRKLRLIPGTPQIFSLEEFCSAVFIRNLSWWRFRAVQTPDSMPPIETEESELDQADQQRFQKTTQIVTSLLLSAVVLLALFRKQLTPPPVVSTHIELQAPKYIPHKEIVEIPPPKPPEPVIEKEKPKPVEPEKIAKKPEKPKQEMPKKKLAKKEPPPMPEKGAPAPKSAAKPKKDPPMVKSDSPPATGVVTKKTEPPPPDQNAQLLKSLSFLSSGSKTAAQGGVEKYSKTAKKDFMASPTLGGGSKDSQVLDSISSKNGNSSIKTRSSREMSSEVGFGSKAGKGLNNVQGKVSLNQIYGSGSSSGAFSEGSGIAISGSGSLSEDEIEKALQKFLSKFQFCYEKALMSDSSLSGNIRIQWTIGTSGRTTDTKIVQSQMKNEGMHSCILGVLKTVPFPSPRGGSVTAKKTFSFKATSI